MNPADIRTGDTDGNGIRLYVNAYYALRFAIYTHMQFKVLLILEESSKLTGGYESAIARDGPLKQVILSNAEYIKNVRASHIPF